MSELPSEDIVCCRNRLATWLHESLKHMTNRQEIYSQENILNIEIYSQNIIMHVYSIPCIFNYHACIITHLSKKVDTTGPTNYVNSKNK